MACRAVHFAFARSGCELPDALIFEPSRCLHARGSVFRPNPNGSRSRQRFAVLVRASCAHVSPRGSRRCRVVCSRGHLSPHESRTRYDVPRGRGTSTGRVHPSTFSTRHGVAALRTCRVSETLADGAGQRPNLLYLANCTTVTQRRKSRASVSARDHGTRDAPVDARGRF